MCVCVCVCVCVLFCLFVFTFGSAGSSLPHRRSLLWHSAFSSCRVWNLSSLIRDRTQASCTESAESYPLGHQGSLLQIRSAVGIVLMVLVILTRGTRYSTINTEDLTVTVRQWPMRLASTSSYYKRLTCEVGQPLKPHTKIGWLTGQCGPTEPNCPGLSVSWLRRGLCTRQQVKLPSCRCKWPDWRKHTQATEKSNLADQGQCHLAEQMWSWWNRPSPGSLGGYFSRAP